MFELNLPLTQLRTKEENSKLRVFDIFRNKFVLLTPEEWVRQQLLHFLINNYDYPQNLIAVEKSIMVNKQLRRYDAVIYSKANEPIMIIECKAPTVKLTSSVFDQIISYNQCLDVEYLLITNGMNHYCIHYTSEMARVWNFMEEIPNYNALI